MEREKYFLPGLCRNHPPSAAPWMDAADRRHSENLAGLIGARKADVSQPNDDQQPSRKGKNHASLPLQADRRRYGACSIRRYVGGERAIPLLASPAGFRIPNGVIHPAGVDAADSAV